MDEVENFESEEKDECGDRIDWAIEHAEELDMDRHTEWVQGILAELYPGDMDILWRANRLEK